MKKVQEYKYAIIPMVMSFAIIGRMPSIARLLLSKNRKFFVSPSPNAILTHLLIRHEAKQYKKPDKKIKQSIKDVVLGLKWRLNEDDLP